MDNDLLCPRCKIPLAYCDGDDGPDYLYCRVCMNVVYDPERGEGEVIGEFT